MTAIKNVILLTIDCLRADHLSCLGYHRETTPQLDRIAKRGILFLQAISNGNSTPTAFRPLLTSTPLSMYNDDKYLSKYRVTIQEALKRNGFTTAAFHSNPYLSSYFGYSRGFDTFVG
ncbi:sulfatase, partial [Thermococci archaeon]